MTQKGFCCTKQILVLFVSNISKPRKLLSAAFLVFGPWFKIRFREKFYVGEGVCNDCITVVFRPDTF